MNIRGSKSGEDGVWILDTLGGVRPVADVNVGVKDQVGISDSLSESSMSVTQRTEVSLLDVEQR